MGNGNQHRNNANKGDDFTEMMAIIEQKKRETKAREAQEKLDAQNVSQNIESVVQDIF